MANKMARDYVAVSFKVPVVEHAAMTAFAKSRMRTLADLFRQGALSEMERQQQKQQAA